MPHLKFRLGDWRVEIGTWYIELGPRKSGRWYVTIGTGPDHRVRVARSRPRVR